MVHYIYQRFRVMEVGGICAPDMGTCLLEVTLSYPHVPIYLGLFFQIVNDKYIAKVTLEPFYALVLCSTRVRTAPLPDLEQGLPLCGFSL